jgi:hypothetical protein
MLFLRAVLALLAYDVVCAFCRFERIHGMVRHWAVAEKNRDPQSAVDKICAAMNYACIWYPKQVLCLQRSFATTYLLRRQGVHAELVLGAQKLPFEAHAWVEVDGYAVNERANVQAIYSVWDRC